MRVGVEQEVHGIPHDQGGRGNKSRCETNSCELLYFKPAGAGEEEEVCVRKGERARRAGRRSEERREPQWLLSGRRGVARDRERHRGRPRPRGPFTPRRDVSFAAQAREGGQLRKR